jgi:class 3 adenylate cyclase
MSDAIPPDFQREVKKTILELDLVAYNDVARLLEENLDVQAVKIFQDQIQRFVNHGLNTVGLRREDVVFGTSGDNAILVFDDAEIMRRFAHAVQNETLLYNNQKSLEAAKRWFRMGAATGMVLIHRSEKQIVGTTISRSVRLETAASRGQLVVDLPTFHSLPDELKKYYGAEESIKGKRQESFQARRCTFIDLSPEAPQFQQSPSAPTRTSDSVSVMAGLVPAIHAILANPLRRLVNTWHKAGYARLGLSIGIITLLFGSALLYMKAKTNPWAPIGAADIQRGLFQRKDHLAISGYFVASCRGCARPRAWAFYVPPSGTFDKWPIEFRRNPWPLEEFLYPDDRPGGSRCVDFPKHVCDAEFTEYDQWKPTHPLEKRRPNTPSLSLTLRLVNSGYELETTNVGDVRAEDIAVEAVAWQVTSPGIDFHRKYSVKSLGSFAVANLANVFEERVPINTDAR